jgi:hypothetical protein
MPYAQQYIPAEILLKNERATVYYSYKHQEWDSPLSNWYTFVEDDEDYEFDVRDLPGYNGERSREEHFKIVQAAIETGHFDDWIEEIKENQ